MTREFATAPQGAGRRRPRRSTCGFFQGDRHEPRIRTFEPSTSVVASSWQTTLRAILDHFDEHATRAYALTPPARHTWLGGDCAAPARRARSIQSPGKDEYTSHPIHSRSTARDRVWHL